MHLVYLLFPLLVLCRGGPGGGGGRGSGSGSGRGSSPKKPKPGRPKPKLTLSTISTSSISSIHPSSSVIPTSKSSIESYTTSQSLSGNLFITQTSSTLSTPSPFSSSTHSHNFSLTITTTPSMSHEPGSSSATSLFTAINSTTGTETQSKRPPGQCRRHSA
ncbi:hypothetical protein F4806DRAFT_452972 [Annulohypoxylon nitens]|nr:hypothetical protein F4806DRAFT_452972 [Annulohypoxylon nitens]